MRPDRSAIALLLVVAYALVSTFGAAFVVCVEADGRRNVETVGAACCGDVHPTPPADVSSIDADEGAPDVRDVPDTDDGCGDCRTHVPALDDAARAHAPRQLDLRAPTLAPAHAVAPGCPSFDGAASPRAGRLAFAPPARPPATSVTGRAAVLRC